MEKGKEKTKRVLQKYSKTPENNNKDLSPSITDKQEQQKSSVFFFKDVDDDEKEV